MSSVHDWEEERSVITDKGDIGFIDFVNDKSMGNYSPSTEGPINISVPFPFVGGKPLSGYIGDRIVNPITIQNTTDEPVEITVKIYDSKPEESFTLSVMEPPSETSDIDYIQQYLELFELEDRILQPSRTLTVWLSCKPKEIGLHTTAVHFSMPEETIERLAFVLAEDKLSKSLTSNKTFNRERKKKLWSNLVGHNDYVAGSRPTRASRQVFRYKLPQYPIPETVRELIGKKRIPEAIEDGLKKENYASYFKHLVIMEELKMEEDMRGYDMECVSMECVRYEGFLTLEVPGLAEKRPSIVYGDFIFAKLASERANDTSPSYQGFVHRIEAEVVFLKFDKEFHKSYRAGNLYNVQFTYNRINMRRLYQAIEATQSLESDFLFPPDSPKKKRQIKPTPLVPVSCLLNEEQISSIEIILGCNGGPPYVIYGPPGTGKTMTLIEAILQLYLARKNARILVCAPSNYAADNILEKLLAQNSVKFQNREILRLNALTRPLEDIKPDYMDFCFYNEGEGLFKCPPCMDLRRFKIIISTYASSCLLYAEGIKQGHFSHIFLDEAGQASEPETMVPLSNLCSWNTVVVLAGDPLQLGPVIYSKDAELYGLGKSFLERLFDYEFYWESDNNYITKLVRNYRCHPSILYLPSQLFYEGELLACKNYDTISSRAWEDMLPNKDFLVFFFGIQGLDEREGSNPSWFNRIEASKVVETIRDLTGKWGLHDEEIGVITPYRQQVLKVKKALEFCGRSDIQVGSVEQFQGQEKQVIIISTVRSTIKHNEFDKNHCLGFLSNPRRFNVAITRARSLLIVIGNPHIVCKDPYWNKLLWHCFDNRSYVGCFLPDRVIDENPEQVDNLYNEQGQPFEDVEAGQPSEVKWEPSKEIGGWGWDDEPPKEVGWEQSNGTEWGQPSEEVGSEQSNGTKWGQPSEEIGWEQSNGTEWGQPSGEVKETSQPHESTGWDRN